jgi:hypothetical protein
MEKIKDLEIEDLENCSQLLAKSIIIREKYMMLSQQSFSNTTAKYMYKLFSNGKGEENLVLRSENSSSYFNFKNSD